jgi:hypothetical protein
VAARCLANDRIRHGAAADQEDVVEQRDLILFLTVRLNSYNDRCRNGTFANTMSHHARLRKRKRDTGLAAPPSEWRTRLRTTKPTRPARRQRLERQQDGHEHVRPGP